MHESLKKFEPYVKDGYIRKVISPCGRLVLFNYSDKTTYENKWDEVTLKARGTVYELSTGKVIARAFDKFFNFSQLSIEKQKTILKSTSFETCEKMDGSLGIVYYYDGEWRVNTRGSFTSDQAVKGKELLDSKYNMYKGYEGNLTILVEIIYPENRIIVDYGQTEELVVLSANFTTVENAELKTCKSLCESSGMRKAPSKHFNSIQELQEHLETLDHTEEGYVVRLENGERVKFKSAEYLKVARIMNHLSPLSLWKAMEDGKVKVDYLEQLPEEFRAEVDKLTEDLEKKYYNRVRSIYEYYEYIIKQIGGLDQEDLRKKIGIFCKENNLQSSSVFAILDKKDDVLDKIIMREIKPDRNVL